VQFYRSVDFLVRVVTRFTAEGLHAGDAVIVVAPAEHLRAYREALAASAVDVPGAIAVGTLVLLDTDDPIAQPLAREGLDGALFGRVVGDAYEKARASSRSRLVRVYGEMVDVLVRSGRAQAALALEDLWCRFADDHELLVLCGYSLGSFGGSERDTTMEAICARHGASEAEARSVLAPRRPAGAPEQRALVLAAAVDERSRAEAALGKVLEVERAARLRVGRLQRVSAALAECITTRDIGDVALGVITESLGASVGSLTVLAADGRSVELASSFGMDPAQLAAFRSIPLESSIAATDAIRTGTPRYVESPAQEAAIDPELAAKSPFAGGARVALPLRARGDAIASLNFGFAEWRAFPQEDRDFMSSVATLAAQALERTRLYESERLAREQTQLLFGLSDIMSRALAIEDVYEPALEAVCTAFKVDRASILTNDEKRVMRFRAWRGLSAGYRTALEGHSPWHPDDPAPSPIFVADVKTDPALAAHRAHLEPEGIAAMAFVPLFARRRLLGKFMVYAREPRRFSQHDERLARAIAAQLSQAILRAQLLESERRERAHAERLADTANRLQAVAAALSEASSVAEVARVIVTEGSRVAGAATAGLWLLSTSEPVLELVVSHEYDSSADGFRRIPLDGPLPVPAVDSVRSREAIWFESRSAFARAYPEVEKLADQRSEHALACLPLLVEGRCVGVLALTFYEVHEFTAEERHPLLALARNCAQAVGRARLFDLEARARADAEAAQQRTTFLLDASALLSSSLDFEETLERLTRLAVPRMADGCRVELAIEPGAPSEELAVAHVDPAQIELARELRRRWPPDRDAPRSVAGVMRTGRSLFETELTDAHFVAAARDEEHLRLLRRLALRSFMIVPMGARGRIFGAITFVSDTSGRRYGKHDLELAELLGRRAGIAIDNALLYQTAQAAVRSRERVLAVVSHDLRNPLGVIQMGAAVLKGYDLSPGAAYAVHKKAELMLRAAERMERLITDLLDFAGMQSDRFTIARKPCAPEEIVAASLEMFLEHARERGVRLEARAAEHLPRIDCDRDRTIQALGNLVSNALKVTPAGGTVIVSAEASDGALAFSVEDTGPGIPAEDLQHLFEPYWRGETARYKGTGLGLAIAKGIASAHGGRITAESRLGSGSRFTLTIPLVPAAQAVRSRE
jgi:signal transduction histidine kinase/putative methionine-R-sulfoxide reductase with GAF domain